MNNNELIQLIDKTQMAALKWSLARRNFIEAEEEYEKCRTIFNEEIPNVDPSKLEMNEELNNKIEFAKVTLDILLDELN